MQETSPITSIKGIGPKSAENFHRAGIYTVGDLISYYPRAYDICEDPVPAGALGIFDDGRTVAVSGRIDRPLSVRYLRSFKVTTGKIFSDGVYLDVTWYNMPFLKNQVLPGTDYVFRGRIKAKGRRIFLQQPKVYDLFDYESLKKTWQPVYPLVRGLTENALKKALREAFYGSDHLDLAEDPLSPGMRSRYALKDRMHAVRDIHFPESEDELKSSRKRLTFDEFFYFILMLRKLRDSRMSAGNGRIVPEDGQTQRVIESLPYKLTGAQLRAWNDISSDMTSGKVMSRLIQGDVGSGKTIVAFLALVRCAANGMQGAMMAPTEVLARQHYDAFSRLCEKSGLPYESVLLTGSLTAKERREALRKISSGEALVIIGTHALITENVEYDDLALVITDEQHRFGVHQRELLNKKGSLPHTIVMSATPIPRTLAVILYGDLDVSLIDEMPADRLRVKNAVVDTAWRPKAYDFISRQIKEGHQAYVICPMVDVSEEIDAENVLEYTDELRAELHKRIPGAVVESLHGKMKSAQKQDIMNRFARNEIQVLVSTTVVEVGVNVPNATVMMVENAERFGLSQLHQLRGRVGRGDAQSYCIFIYSTENENIKKRLDILGSTNDGFEIARKDLELRGPGELFGLRQSGELNFQIADIYADADALKDAQSAVTEILEKDPGLALPENRSIARTLEKYGSAEHISV